MPMASLTGEIHIGRLPPTLVSSWVPTRPQLEGSGVGVLMINFNTASQTARCLESLAQSVVPPDWVLVLDNASEAADYERLRRLCSGLSCSELRLYRSEVNLGFAAGSNFLINELLAISECLFVSLLNNDAIATPIMIKALLDSLRAHPEAGLAGGRMHRLDEPECVDTLGITIYASLMPADRKVTSDTYLGPTGGCLLMTRAVIERLIQVSGYCFDDRFFCYCEDTDLVLRSVLLGYRPLYVDDLIALHEGQASSGGAHNSFISYHGLRNTMWMHWKLMPSALLLKYAVPLAIAHLLSATKLLLNGEFRLLWAIYRDALSKCPEFIAERRRFGQFCLLSAVEINAYIVPSFYRRGYLALSLRQLRHRYVGKLFGRKSATGR